MQPVVMLETRRGSPDGIAAYWYVSGREYPSGDVPMTDDLAAVFLREGWATPASDFAAPATGKETKVEVATDTEAVCGVMTARGTPCQLRRPCRFHDD